MSDTKKPRIQPWAETKLAQHFDLVPEHPLPSTYFAKKGVGLKDGIVNLQDSGGLTPEDVDKLIARKRPDGTRVFPYLVRKQAAPAKAGGGGKG